MTHPRGGSEGALNCAFISTSSQTIRSQTTDPQRIAANIAKLPELLLQGVNRRTML
jgi:hypothetical protein